MEFVLRPVAIYLFVTVILRVSGKRTLAEVTTFDLILLLIISEALQQGLIGDDFSVTAALVVVTTLVGTDLLMTHLQIRFPRLGRVMDGLPVVLVDNGRVLPERMKKSRVTEDEILESARELQGVGTMADIKYAVLERSGAITIVPRS